MSKVMNPDFLAAIPAAASKFLKRAGVKSNVKIQCSGDTAYTQFHGTGRDGDTMRVLINMPALDASGYMTRAQADLYIGYILHEISHNLWTDNQQWNDATHSVPYERRKAAHKILNALEDVRIENVSIRENVAGRFQERLEMLIEFMHVRALAGGFNPNSAGGMLWTICVLGRVELNGYNVPSAAGMRAKMNAKNNAFVSEILARLKTAKDTADTGVIMLWILDNINQSPAAQDDDKNVGDAQDDDTGGGLADPGAEDDDAPGGDVGTGGVGDDADDAIDWKTNDADDLEDTEPNVADVTEQIGTDVYNAEVLNSVLSRAVVSREIQTEAAIHGNGDRLEDYKDGVPVPSKLKTQIRSIVSAPGRVDKRRWQENGRLDLRAVPAMRCGARNVYKRRRKTEAVQSVVSLLIDLSHSMNGRRRIGAAVGLAGHLGECLKAAGVSFEIMGFKGSDKSYAIKTLSEPWNVSAMANVATSANAANGQTNISSAIVRASQRLRGVQNVTRRIVLVLTDGDCGYGPRAVKASIKYAETIGVETAGIGLQNDVSGVFPVSQSVFDVADLARDGLGVLAKTLGRAR